MTQFQQGDISCLLFSRKIKKIQSQNLKSSPKNISAEVVGKETCSADKATAVPLVRVGHGFPRANCRRPPWPRNSSSSHELIIEARHRLLQLLQAKWRRRRWPEGTARDRSARIGAGDCCASALPSPQRGVPSRGVLRAWRHLRGRGRQLRREDGGAQRQRGAPAASQRARHVLQAGHVARRLHGGAPHHRRRGPRRPARHPRRRLRGPPLRARRRSAAPDVLVVAGRGVVAPRREGRPHGLHRGGARVRGASGERGGGGEVRGDAAPGGAGVGADGDQRGVVVVAPGAVGRRVEPPPREHARRHLRRGAPGLGLPQQGAHPVGVQHPSPGLQHAAITGAELGQQRARHAPLGLRREPRGTGGDAGAGRRGGRQLQAPDGGAVPDLQPSAQRIHRHRQGPEELGLLEQERVRGAVRLQPRIQVRVVRQKRIRVHRAGDAEAGGAAAWSNMAGGSVHLQPKPVDFRHRLLLEDDDDPA